MLARWGRLGRRTVGRGTDGGGVGLVEIAWSFVRPSSTFEGRKVAGRGRWVALLMVGMAGGEDRTPSPGADPGDSVAPADRKLAGASDALRVPWAPLGALPRGRCPGNPQTPQIVADEALPHRRGSRRTTKSTTIRAISKALMRRRYPRPRNPHPQPRRLRGPHRDRRSSPWWPAPHRARASLREALPARACGGQHRT